MPIHTIAEQQKRSGLFRSLTGATKQRTVGGAIRGIVSRARSGGAPVQGPSVDTRSGETFKGGSSGPQFDPRGAPLRNQPGDVRKTPVSSLAGRRKRGVFPRAAAQRAQGRRPVAGVISAKGAIGRRLSRLQKRRRAGVRTKA